MSSTRLLPPSVVTDSVECLAAHHGVQRPVTYWMFVACIAGTIAALPLIHVDVSVGARGVTRAAAERVVLRAPVGGEIKSVAVRNDSSVRRGDTILVLESRMLSGRIALNRQQQGEVNQQLSDLAWLIETTTGLSALERDVASSASAPGAMPDAALATFQTAAYLRQWEYFVAQLQTRHLQAFRARHERERVATLHQRGLVSEHEFEQSGYAADGARLERQLLVRQNASRWQAERLEKQSRLQELLAEAFQLDRQEELYTVRAPTDGTVLDFTGLDVGAFVANGVKLAEITPDGKLVVDAHIQPKDFGFVRVGQSARLLVDAFPHTQWGALSGTVRSLSADLVQVGGQTMFKALIELDSTNFVSATGTRALISKGLGVNVRLVVSRRSLLDLVRGRVSDWLDPRAG